MNPADETVLTRFAGGDMSVAEETEFLACCEIQQDLWRTAALALVEHRQFVRALREFAHDRSDVSVNSEEGATGHSKMRWSTTAMVAASLLALMLGGLSVTYWSGQHRGDDVRPVYRDSPVAVPKTTEPTYTVYVHAPSERTRTTPPRAHLPTTDGTEGTARWAAMNSRPVFPEKARSLMHQVGVEVVEEPILYVFDDGSGEHWAVPVRNFRLSYVNHENSAKRCSLPR